MTGSDATFWDHLDILRGVLIKIVAVMIVLGVAAFFAMPWIFENVIMAPCSPDFPTAKLFDSIAAFMGDNIGGDVSIDIVSIELASQLFMHFSSSDRKSVV